jgi:uncharacterized protein
MVLSATAWAKLAPWGLLIVSNVFMTFAWYGHLKFKEAPLIKVILISWLIAGAEYAIAVPANRLGATVYSPAQLKTIQECITLVVFAAFSLLYFGEPLRLSTAAGFVLIFAGAALVFMGRS